MDEIENVRYSGSTQSISHESGRQMSISKTQHLLRFINAINLLIPEVTFCQLHKFCALLTCCNMLRYACMVAMECAHEQLINHY